MLLLVWNSQIVSLETHRGTKSGSDPCGCFRFCIERRDSKRATALAGKRLRWSVFSEGVVAERRVSFMAPSCIMHGFLHILSRDIISFHDRLISTLPVRKSIMFICVMPLFEVSFLSRLKTYLGEWFVRFLNAPYSRSKVF